MKGWVTYIAVWWQALTHPESAGQLILGVETCPGLDRFLAAMLTVLYAVYGLSMGLFRGGLPAAVSALKLPLLFLLTLIVCFPLLYALNCLLGPRLRINHCLRLLLLANSVHAVAISSYAPFSYFFTLTTSRSGYGFIVLMHVGVFAVAGILSVIVIGLIFRATAAAVGRPLRPSFLLAWSVLYAFVGTQMSWILRPWIGNWYIPYTPFRPIEGSFIESVWRLLF